MGYANLEAYYKTLFSLAQVHNISMSEIECMIPYERDLFVEMLAAKIREAQSRNKQGHQ